MNIGGGNTPACTRGIDEIVARVTIYRCRIRGSDQGTRARSLGLLRPARLDEPAKTVSPPLRRNGYSRQRIGRSSTSFTSAPLRLLLDVVSKRLVERRSLSRSRGPGEADRWLIDSRDEA